jgi:hypothetical protein
LKGSTTPLNQYLIRLTTEARQSDPLSLAPESVVIGSYKESVTALLCHVNNFYYLSTMIGYLTPLVISWWFTHFEPLQNYIDNKLNLPDWLHTSLGCWKCLSFWGTWAYSQSFTVACATSLTAVCLNKLIYNS